MKPTSFTFILLLQVNKPHQFENLMAGPNSSLLQKLLTFQSSKLGKVSWVGGGMQATTETDLYLLTWNIVV